MLIKENSTITNLAPYQLADLSVPEGKTLISLAQNELCFSPTTEVINAASQALKDAQLYPDPDWSALVKSIASVHNINHAQILCGAGSMELLEVLGRTYLSANDQVVMSEYGYSFFKTVALMNGSSVEMAAEVNFTVSIDNILSLVKPNTKMVFLANPANPTGTLISADEIRHLRDALDSNILLILDEAYAEFTDSNDYRALFDLVDIGNTVVLRTFSKIYGLAGMRVGWGYIPVDIYTTMRKALNPNNIPLASQAAAATAMQQQNIVNQRKADIKTIKTKFCSSLEELGLTTAESHSNFILINFDCDHKTKICFNQLRQQGIMMRPMGAYGLNHCLRATICIEENMKLTIKHLARILEGFK